LGEQGQLRIGTSGWVYKHWLDIFYPRTLASAEQLPFYAEHFDTVEINRSFYRLPGRNVFEQWRAQTPPGFLFAVKGSRFLTHMKKLKDPEEPLQRLMQSAAGLEEKLGPILLQFPSAWQLNLERLAAFVAALQAYPDRRFSFEFRHRSWLSPPVYDLLRGIGAALCLPVSPNVPLDPTLTTNWTYIRMHSGAHGTGYGDEELTVWAERIRAWRDQGVDVYVYFNNDPEGHALRDAVRLHTMLEANS
jgi:uncharacterized protein YecE (DUF72 family)